MHIWNDNMYAQEGVTLLLSRTLDKSYGPLLKGTVTPKIKFYFRSYRCFIFFLYFTKILSGSRNFY
jgi:hypothetical protein